MSNQLHNNELIAARDAAGEDRLTPVLFARSGAEATRFCALLEDADIPALVGDHMGKALKGLGVPILVPESLAAWSSEILAAKQAGDGADRFDDDDEEDDDEDEADDDSFPDDPDDDDDDDEFVDGGPDDE